MLVKMFGYTVIPIHTTCMLLGDDFCSFFMMIGTMSLIRMENKCFA